MTPNSPNKPATTASRHLPYALIAVATAIALNACGGGSGSSAGGGETPPPIAGNCLALPHEIDLHREALSSDWTDVAIDARGRLWIAGWTNGIVGQSNIEPSGNSRPALRAHSANGTLLSDAGSQFDTTGTDTLEALAITPMGTVFAAGRTNGSLGGTANAGQFDSFVAWSDDSNDSKPWRVLQTGTAAPQHPRRLAADDQGNVVLAGEDDDYVVGNAVQAWSDAFVLRWQRVGIGTSNERLAPVWAWQAASPEADYIGGLALAPAAGVVSFVSGTHQGGASKGAVLRKITANGQLSWTARYSNSATDHVAAVRLLKDGSLLIGGTVSGSFRGGVAMGQQDIFIARIDAEDGSVLQSWQFGSEGSEWLADMQLDDDGNVILFGETTGRMAQGVAPAGQADLFLMRISPDGRVLASRQWGSSGDERANRLAVDRCGNAVAVGSSTSNGHRDALTWFWPR